MARDYSNSPKLAPNGDGGVKVDDGSAPAATTGNAATSVGPGPNDANRPDFAMADVTGRHDRERSDMISRHSTEMSDMQERHLTEWKSTHKRHAKEIGDAFSAGVTGAATDNGAAAAGAADEASKSSAKE